MNRPNASTRDRIVNAALELFYEKGFHSTPVSEILKRADVHSGSLYYFFENKESLLVAVLDRYYEMLYERLVDPLTMPVEDPVEKVFALLAGYRHMLIVSELNYGCPIGNLANEIGNAIPRARQRIADNFRQWCEAVEKNLILARDRFPDGTDFRALSQMVLTVMEGAVMQARTHQNIEPYDSSIRQLRDYFTRLMSDSKAASKS